MQVSLVPPVELTEDIFEMRPVASLQENESTENNESVRKMISSLLHLMP